jgi:PKD repeat protein
MPDGSIVVMGGTVSGGGYRNDVWRFMPVGSSAQNPSHTYTAPGVYMVALQAYNAGGYNSTRKAGYITVTAVPVANFTANVTSGTVPLVVQFIDNSTGFPTGWNWTFGDIGGSNTSTLQNPVHTYLTHGNFTVSLNAANTGGNSTIQKTAYISVRIKGDINNNDHVDIGDVTSVAYMVVRLMPPDIAAADFNSNGRVDIGDAAKIAYYYVGKIGSL